MKRIALLLVGFLATSACNDEITGLEPPSDPATETFAASLNVNIATMSKTPEGVFYQDIVVGTGTEVVAGTDSLRASYAGYLKDGTLFDSGTNTKFILSDVIAGFRSGLIGMKAGGRRKLVIPSELGYGAAGRRDPITGARIIPRQATLVFDVDVITVHNPAPPSGT